MKYSLFLLSIFLVTPGYSLPYEQDNKAKPATVEMDIATESGQKVTPTPFYSESTSNELMERIEELDARVKRLEVAVETMQKPNNIK